MFLTSIILMVIIAGLNPLNLNLALTYAGIKPPLIKNACELGFGQGISINFHNRFS